MNKKTTIWPGYDLPTNALQKLYRERYLKISQTEMATLTGVKQPNLARHESGASPIESVGKAFDALGFCRWSESVATCEEEASMIEDMIVDDSGVEWMPGDKWRQLEQLRARKGGAA